MGYFSTEISYRETFNVYKFIDIFKYTERDKQNNSIIKTITNLNIFC